MSTKIINGRPALDLLQNNQSSDALVDMMVDIWNVADEMDSLDRANRGMNYYIDEISEQMLNQAGYAPDSPMDKKVKSLIETSVNMEINKDGELIIPDIDSSFNDIPSQLHIAAINEGTKARTQSFLVQQEERERQKKQAEEKIKLEQHTKAAQNKPDAEKKQAQDVVKNLLINISKNTNQSDISLNDDETLALQNLNPLELKTVMQAAITTHLEKSRGTIRTHTHLEQKTSNIIKAMTITLKATETEVRAIDANDNIRIRLRDNIKSYVESTKGRKVKDDRSLKARIASTFKNLIISERKSKKIHLKSGKITKTKEYRALSSELSHISNTLKTAQTKRTRDNSKISKTKNTQPKEKIPTQITRY